MTELLDYNDLTGSYNADTLLAMSLFAHKCVNAFVCLATSRSAPGYEPFANERTTTIEATASDQGCVEWNESFSFVVPASESARGDLSLTVMDHHLIRGDVPYSPVFKINIDELKISKERQFESRFYHFGVRDYTRSKAFYLPPHCSI